MVCRAWPALVVYSHSARGLRRVRLRRGLRLLSVSRPSAQRGSPRQEPACRFIGLLRRWAIVAACGGAGLPRALALPLFRCCCVAVVVSPAPAGHASRRRIFCRDQTYETISILNSVLRGLHLCASELFCCGQWESGGALRQPTLTSFIARDSNAVSFPAPASSFQMAHSTERGPLMPP
jgi:hypothetical protein